VFASTLVPNTLPLCPFVFLRLSVAFASRPFAPPPCGDNLAILYKYLGEAQGGLVRVNADSSPALQAKRSFVRALLCAELGRADEARRDFTKGRANLKLALGDKPGHDRGGLWWASYDAESRQREAEAVFKAKGIPLPEQEAK
jgi:hypothetical protein